MVKPTKHHVSFHANLRRRQRTNLSFTDFANAELERKIVRNGVVVTVLPKQKKNETAGSRFLFRMLYKEDKATARAVRLNQWPRDDTKYLVEFLLLPKDVRLLHRSMFTTFLKGDGTLNHGAIRNFDGLPSYF